MSCLRGRGLSDNAQIDNQEEPDILSEQTALAWLMRWYLDQCDGDWEHGYGIRIGTLDNPGWSLTVDLKGTKVDGLEFPRLSNNYEHDSDWWTCWTENNRFRAAGGPLQLTAMIDTFRTWVTGQGRVSD